MTSPASNSSPIDRLVIRRPDDWHTHLRDGEMLKSVANFTARQFGRAIIMPNLPTPITTIAAAEAYKTRITDAVDTNLNFTPLMTCYLTDSIEAEEVELGFNQGVFTACKLYPANATTNSSHGVTDIKNIHSVLEKMQKIGMPLLVHGEVTDSDIDIFDREAVFIDRIMTKLIKDFPELKIVFEHITTGDAALFVEESGPNLAATITPHHLAFNRNAMLVGGIQPHYYCLPVAKREKHRLALRAAATSGSEKFFLGTDTAPHLKGDKESACGCAGIFNAPFAIESYAAIFEEEGALDLLEGFASEYGPKFYDLPLNDERVVLERQAVTVPASIAVADSEVVPFCAEKTLPWRIAS